MAFQNRADRGGGDVNAVTANGNGNTALHWAALVDDGATVQALLDHGADTTIVNHRGETAQDVAQGDAKNVLVVHRSDIERGLLRKAVGLPAGDDQGPVQRSRKM
ncbi:MAG: ankyrin repeat domain-containing protein [Rhodanobacter sp.]|nr:MAG: ankyrin repeat domain-containing protein [Rhodanobacter sp.]